MLRTGKKVIGIRYRQIAGEEQISQFVQRTGKSCET